MSRWILFCLIPLALFEFSVPCNAQEPPAAQEPKKRARDWGVPFDGTPGPKNSITDVAGVLVGHSTVIDGEGEHAARTGVTAVLPNREIKRVFAAIDVFNGDGEMTGSHFVEEYGLLISPIMITNTISVGTVHEATIRWSLTKDYARGEINLPVVAETWDGFLNDIYGFHVTDEHVFAALDNASSDEISEGNVGGGTGMMCHLFKGGIGTSSRTVAFGDSQWTVGVLVQANYGMRDTLMIGGAPVGKHLQQLMPDGFRRRVEEQPSTEGELTADEVVQYNADDPEDGSIIVVIATDAPLLPHQLNRVARRAALGLGRVGSMGGTGSGDIFIAFSTTGLSGETKSGLRTAELVPESKIDPIFSAAVWATEEAIINAMVAAEDMIGVNGHKVYALPTAEVVELLEKMGRLESPNSE